MTAARRRRERQLPARAPGPVRAHGRRVAHAVMGIDNPARGAAVQRRGADQGHAELLEVHEQLAGARRPRTQFIGNIEGTTVDARARRRRRDGRLHRQHHAEADRGRLRTTMRAIRDAAMTSARSKLGGWLLRPALGGAARGDRPRGPGRRVHARAAPARRGPHGRFTRRGFARRSGRRPRGPGGRDRQDPRSPDGGRRAAPARARRRRSAADASSEPPATVSNR